MFNKDAKKFNGVKTIFSKSGTTIGYLYGGKIKFQPLTSHNIKINLKYINE